MTDKTGVKSWNQGLCEKFVAMANNPITKNNTSSIITHIKMCQLYIHLQIITPLQMGGWNGKGINIFGIGETWPWKTLGSSANRDMLTW